MTITIVAVLETLLLLLPPGGISKHARAVSHACRVPYYGHDMREREKKLPC